MKGMRNKNSLLNLLVALSCMALPFGAIAQNTNIRHHVDSSVTEFANGDVVIDYSVFPIGLGIMAPQSIPHQLAFSEEEKERHNEELLTANPISVGIANISLLSEASLSDYAVGEISIEEGISSSGARTYKIPIPAASQMKLFPSIALCYNSQAADGWAGYGWDIQGIPAISLISHNMYYHGEIRAANVQDDEPVFSLNGVPLVKNSTASTAERYPLKTATGHILVSYEKNTCGYISRFTALYPNGMTFTFGVGLNEEYLFTSYPVTTMCDVYGNQIKFNYIIDAINGNHCISSIYYGFDSSGYHRGEISFDYKHQSGSPIKYYAGKQISRDYLLTSITSSSEGLILRKYDLGYEEKDGVQLLIKVECTSRGEQLCPIEFTYGDGSQPSISSGKLEEADYKFLSAAYNTDETKIYCKRGKFVAGSQDDGLITYPVISNYGAVKSKKEFLGKRYYKYGSMYAETQAILFTASHSSVLNAVTDTSLVTGSGFQTIEAADVDGDGVDEIVKVNYNGTSDTKTKLLISVFKCDRFGIPRFQYSFEVEVGGRIKSGDYISPYKLAYYWGDFSGTGKVQLLTIAYDRNYNNNKNYDQTSYLSLIDIAEKRKLSEEELFEFPIDRSGCLIVHDIDNDARAEMCYATDSGFDIYRLQKSGSFIKDVTLNSPTASVLASDERPYHLTDINGDGYVDILCAPAIGGNAYWDRYAYTGTDFLWSRINIAARQEDDMHMFMDVNRDGLSDLIGISGTTLGTYINNDGSSFGSFQQSPSQISDVSGIVSAGVKDYAGASCFIKVDGFRLCEYVFTSLAPKSRYLTRVVDSHGKIHDNTYSYLPEESIYWSDAALTVDNAAGFAKKTLPIYVLRAERGYYGTHNTLYKNRNYQYHDAIIHNTGLGFCGFSKVRTDDCSGRVTEICYEYHNPEHMGVVAKVEKYSGSIGNAPYYKVEYTHDNHNTKFGKLSPRLVESIELDGVTGIETTIKWSYDDYDYPLVKSTSKRIGTGEAMTENVSYTYSHSVDTSLYLLGRVREEGLVREGDGGGLSWQERIVTTHDEFLRPVTQHKYVGEYGRKEMVLPPLKPIDPVFPGLQDSIDVQAIKDTILPNETIRFYKADSLVSETRWEYDVFGNIISEKVAPYGAEVFTGTTYTYDSEGRYVKTKTDALGHTVVYGNYDEYGNHTISTDHMGRITTYMYDVWGNLGKIVFPDGAEDVIERAWGGLGKYTELKTSTGHPDCITHYDALGRAVRVGEMCFDGQWRYVDEEYDCYGKLQRKSRPYRGASVSYWTTYEYDNYGRLIRLAEASGKESIWSYNGTSVTSTEDGLCTTKTTDANGALISVTDAGGTISYVLRDDGQPSSICADGVVTIFAYDGYGRRKQIEDPSAGLQSETYSWNADGSSVVTCTNPNGCVITKLDKYGRTMSIERPGEYGSLYTYDSYGRVVEIRSTNGTAVEYTYDTNDRILTAKEIVPDGKWMKRTYSYLAGGAVSNIEYTTQDGVITSESYSYVNGHNTAITLPNGVPVWSLISENDLGMTTKAMTGDVVREYGFNDFGLPTYRRLNYGALQDFTYSFDVHTGNLAMRGNTIHNQTEMFRYDGLNRIISMGECVIGYENNGNVVSMGGVGTMEYADTLHPYRITSLFPEDITAVQGHSQSISYTCYSRPSVLKENGKSAAFTYDVEGRRVKMYVAEGASQILTRWYIGDRYECDSTPVSTSERLWLGGDAYSASMVYIKESNGAWKLYNIGRDYLGSITHVATSDGTLIAEYSYDAWGRLRDPQTLDLYAAGEEPTLVLGGRGYTGHEHMPWFGLINMNARLYDPLLGRFLSPDPYVQSPENTQNFNRYSYALNNPLRYTDENGEFLLSAVLLSAGIGAAINVAFNWSKIDSVWEGVIMAVCGAGVGAVAAVTGGAGLGGQLLAGMGTGMLDSMVTNSIEQFGASGNGAFDWGSFARSAISGAVTGMATAGANKIANGLATKLVNKAEITSRLSQNVLGNTLEGAMTGLVSGAVNSIGEQYEDHGFKKGLNWSSISLGMISGALIGGTMGAANGLIKEGIYQEQLKKRYNKFLNSDVADVLVDSNGDFASELSSLCVWPFGHNYATPTINLAGSICIDSYVGKCTISIDPYAPMVPTVSTYYYQKK